MAELFPYWLLRSSWSAVNKPREKINSKRFHYWQGRLLQTQNNFYSNSDLSCPLKETKILNYRVKTARVVCNFPCLQNALHVLQATKGIQVALIAFANEFHLSIHSSRLSSHGRWISRSQGRYRITADRTKRVKRREAHPGSCSSCSSRCKNQRTRAGHVPV